VRIGVKTPEADVEMRGAQPGVQPGADEERAEKRA
jgi:hypothetical protein